MKSSLTLILVLATTILMGYPESYGLMTTNSHESANAPQVTVPQPIIKPFDGNLCEDEWRNVTIELAVMEPGASYQWQIPSFLTHTEAADGSSVTITDFGEALAQTPPSLNFSLAVIATKPGCQPNPLAIGIQLRPEIELKDNPLDVIQCTGKTIEIVPDVYYDNPNRIRGLEWDFDGGVVASGDSLTKEEFTVKYETAGPKNITLTVLDNFGCRSSRTYNIEVYDSPPLPKITCPYIDGTQVQFEFEQEPGYTYESMWQVGPPSYGVVDSNNTMVNVSNVTTTDVMILQLSAYGTSPAPCDSTTFLLTCRACIPTDIDFGETERTVFCLGETNTKIDVKARVNSEQGNDFGINPPQGEYFTDPSVNNDGFMISADGTSAMFDPSGLPPGRYHIGYRWLHPIDGCDWPAQNQRQAFTVTIFPTPEPNLTTDLSGPPYQICSDTFMTVFFEDYEGIPPPDITAFKLGTSGGAGGQVARLSGGESARIDFPDEEGVYNVKVQYEVVGNPQQPTDRCLLYSDDFDVQVDVEPELTLECDDAVQEAEAINITWNDIPYNCEVFLNGVSVGIVTQGQNGTRIPMDPSTGLPLEANTIYNVTVVPQGLMCGDVSETIQCMTVGCVPPTFTWNNETLVICGDDPFRFDVTVTHPDPAIEASYVWCDPTLITSDGELIPIPGQEEYTTCLRSDLCEEEIPFSFTYIAKPEAAIAVLGDTICVTGGMATLSSGYTSPNPGNVTYQWSLPAEAFPPTLADAGPTGVTFDTPGEYQVGLVVSNLGCTSDLEEVTIVVQDELPPLDISCEGGQQLIDLSWTPNACVTEYEIYVDNVLLASTTTSNFRIDVLPGGGPLMDNTEYNWEVRPVSTCKCEGVGETGSCMTNNCPDPLFDNRVEPEQCYDWVAMDSIFLDITLESSDPSVASTYEWVDPSIVNDKFLPTVGQSDYNLEVRFIVPSDPNCDRSFFVPISLKEYPVVDLAVTGLDTICIDNATTMLQLNNSLDPGATFNWDLSATSASTNAGDTDAGPFEVTFDSVGDKYVGVTIDNNGCVSEKDSILIVVEDLLPEPDVMCSASRNELTLSWTLLDCAAEYEIIIDGTPVDTVAGSQFTIDGLTEATDYAWTVRAFSDCACGNSEKSDVCTTTNCTAPDFQNNVLAEMCYDFSSMDSIPLDIVLQSATGSGNTTYEWVNPSIVNDKFLPTPGTFVYNLEVIYKDLDDPSCDQSFFIPFTLNEYPTVDLELTGGNVLCVRDATTQLQDNFVAGAGATYNWDLSATSATTNGGDTDPGPFDVTFDAVGDYYLYLSINNSGCASELDSILVTVEDTLLAPAVMCNGTRNELSLSWTAVDCASGYDIYLEGVLVDNTTSLNYQIPGLTENTPYNYEVVAVSECACDSSVFAGMCETTLCDASLITYNDPGPICYDPADGAITLDLTVESSNPALTASFTWQADALQYMDAPDGLEFTPVAGTESYSLVLDYMDETGCPDVFTVPVEVIFSPESQMALLGADNICVDGGEIIIISEYTSASSDIEYAWTFPMDATVVNDFDEGPYTLTFDSAGPKEIKLLITTSGCPGIEETMTVNVEPALAEPDVTCAGGLDQIQISWADVDCASEYEIALNGDILDTIDVLEYTFENLEKETAYDFTVTAISDCECGNAVFSDNCETQPCPTVSITEQNESFCFGATEAPFEATWVITPDDGTGTLSGELVDGDGMIDISLAPMAGEYMLDYSYDVAGCITTATMIVNLTEAPTVSVDVQSPLCPEEPGGMVTVIAEGGNPDYMYTVEGVMQNDPVFTQVPIGAFSVEVEDASGCVITTSGEVLDIIEPLVEIEGETRVIEESNSLYTLQTDIAAEDITDIIWYLDGSIVCSGITCTSFLLENVTNDGTLEVEVFYGTMCSVRKEIEIEVTIEPGIYVPDVVDFGGAAPNNVWTVFSTGPEVIISKVVIYDRWGNVIEVFENATMDYSRELVIWDGFSGSEQALPGVYTYVIGLDIEGVTQQKGGNITVLR